MKKRMITMIICTVAAMSLCACGSEKDTLPEIESAPAEAEISILEPEIPEEVSIDEPEEPEEVVDEYMLPDSDKRYLTEEDIKDLSAEDLRIARNEIFARRGRKFNDSELMAYFESQSWYKGTMDPEEFDSKSSSLLNKYESANVTFIKDYEDGTADKTFQLVKDYGFYSPGGEWGSMVKLHNTSLLAFRPDFSTMTDRGDHYEVKCTIERFVEVNTVVYTYDSVMLTTDYITGKQERFDADGELNMHSEDGGEYWMVDVEGKSALMDANASADFLYAPYAKGTLKINKNIPAGYFYDPDCTIETLKDSPYTWFNAVSFDDNGYVTGMFWCGD